MDRVDEVGAGDAGGCRVRERRGAMLIEAVVAAGIVAVSAVVIMRAVVVTQRQQQALARRSWAARAVENLQERFTARPWEAITDDWADTLGVPAAIGRNLPGARLDVDVRAVPGPPPAKRITVTLDWRTGAQRRARPVRLVTWVFQPKGASP